MKLTIAGLSLALGVTALVDHPTLVDRDTPSLVERDLATITGVIAQVDTSIKSLTSAAQAFSGGNGAALTTASQNLVNTIKTGTTTVAGTTNLTLEEAVQLQSLVSGLQTDATALTNALAAKKNDIQTAGLCSTTLQQTTDVAAASKALIAAIVSKVPEAAQGIAAQAAAGFSATLDQASATFSAGNCTNSGGGGGGSSSSTSSTTVTRTGTSTSTRVTTTTTTGSSSSSSSTGSTGSGGGGGGGGCTPTTYGTSSTSRGSSAPTTAPTGSTSVRPTSTTTSVTRVTGNAAATAAAAPVGALALALVAALL